MTEMYVFRFHSTREGHYLIWDSPVPGRMNVREVPLPQAKVSPNRYYFLDCISNENIIAVPVEVAEAIDL